MTRDLRQSGFTLLEMLVALTMIVTIVSMVYGSYAATSQACDIYDSRLTCSGRAQLTLRLMSRQIRCAYAPTNEPNETESAERSKEKRVEEDDEIFYGDAKDAKGQFLRFVTTAGLGHTLTTQRGLARIAYRYDRLAGTLSIDYGPFERRPETPERIASWQPILDGVMEIEIAFHDGKKWQSQWRDFRTAGLPRAVTISLTVVDQRNREHRFSTAVPILCRTQVAPAAIQERRRGVR